VLLVSVSRRLEERRDKETKTKTKKNESFGRVQKRKIYLTTTLQKTRSGKVRRERKNISGVENSFKKLRPFSFAKVFISFIRLGAEKTSEEHDDAYAKRSFIHDLCPLSFYLFGKTKSKKGLQTFESRLTLDDCVKSATTPFGKKDKTQGKRGRISFKEQLNNPVEKSFFRLPP